MYPVERKMTNHYVRVERDGEWKNIDFSDLTGQEMKYVTSNMSKERLIELCCRIGYMLQRVGNQFDINNPEDKKLTEQIIQKASQQKTDEELEEDSYSMSRALEEFDKKNNCK